MADYNGRGGSGENSKAVGKHFKLRRRQKSKLHEEGFGPVSKQRNELYGPSLNTDFKWVHQAMGQLGIWSYICLMTKCLKCQKEFTPKRRGGFFCGDSCGNSYRQQLQRNEQQKVKLVEKGHAVKNPLTNEELELWRFVEEVAATAKQILADRNLPDEQRPKDLRARVNQLVEQCREKGESQLISGIASRYSAQEEAAKRAEAYNKGKHKNK